MIVKLKEIADLQFGLYEKNKIKGEVKYLHAGHFNNSYQPTKFEQSYVNITEKSNKFLLKPNDVILAGKGHRVFAWAYDANFGPTIPSSLFYIIRTDPNIILGEYLAYYLNTDKLQFELKLIGAGGTIPSISKSELEQIKIIIPSIKEQTKIVGLAKLLDRNIELSKEIIEKKKRLKRGLINKMITNQIKIK